MAFWFKCPICQSKRLATEGIIGRRVRCADCSNFVEVSRSASGNHVDQEEMDRLIDQLITDDDVVNDDEVDIAHPGNSDDTISESPGSQALSSKQRFRDGPETDLPAIEDEADDVNALETESSEMDIKPLKASRPVQAEETDYSASGEFSLSPPSEGIVEVEVIHDAGQPGEPPVEGVRLDPDTPVAAAKAKKNLEWKTVPTEEDPDFVDPPLMGEKKEREETEMDMTPMVDVTFLLLIFFMVTASFVLQKSMNRPTETVDDPSTEVVIDTEDSQDIIQVDIAADNTYYITLPEEEQIEAPSEQDLRIALAGAGDGGSTGIIPTKMLIRAHEESFHGRVITAMDVGTELGLALQVQITADDL